MTAEPGLMAILLATVGSVFFAVGVVALAFDCICWFRQYQARRDVFKACDQWHGEQAEAAMRNRKERRGK